MRSFAVLALLLCGCSQEEVVETKQPPELKCIQAYDQLVVYQQEQRTEVVKMCAKYAPVDQR